jgi:hypothetical protein
MLLDQTVPKRTPGMSQRDPKPSCGDAEVAGRRAIVMTAASDLFCGTLLTTAIESAREEPG